MYVCVCRSITDSQICEAVCNGVRCIKDLNTYVGAPIQCGKCCRVMKEIMDETLSALS